MEIAANIPRPGSAPPAYSESEDLDTQTQQQPPSESTTLPARAHTEPDQIVSSQLSPIPEDGTSTSEAFRIPFTSSPAVQSALLPERLDHVDSNVIQRPNQGM